MGESSRYAGFSWIFHTSDRNTVNHQGNQWPCDKFHKREQHCFLIQEGNWGIHPLQGWTNMIPVVTIKLADEWDPKPLVTTGANQVRNQSRFSQHFRMTRSKRIQTVSVTMCLSRFTKSLMITSIMLNPNVHGESTALAGAISISSCCFYNPNAFTPTSPHF